MIKFTIITCTYNAERVLQRTLDSVKKQTYCNIEHIIMDGGSSDKTLSMVRAYQHKISKGENAHDIVVVAEPDRGLYDAMNKSIDRATGDYLVFLNAGDVFPSAETLEYVAGCVGEGEVLPGVLYGDTDIVDATGRFLHHRRLQPPAHLSWRSFRWVGAVITHYLDGGMSVQNHRASLRERFEVMRTHYGLLTTLFVHAWFVVRSIFKR